MLTHKNSFYFGDNDMTNCREEILNEITNSEDIFVNNSKDSNNYFNKIFLGQAEPFTIEQLSAYINFDPMLHKKYFFNKDYNFLSKFKVVGCILPMISDIFNPEGVFQPLPHVKKDDSLIHFAFISLINLTRSKENKSMCIMKSKLKYYKEVIFGYISYFMYGDFYNSYYLLNNSYVEHYIRLFNYFPIEILTIIYTTVCEINLNAEKENFRKRNKVIHFDKLINALKNFMELTRVVSILI